MSVLFAGMMEGAVIGGVIGAVCGMAAMLMRKKLPCPECSEILPNPAAKACPKCGCRLDGKGQRRAAEQ